MTDTQPTPCCDSPCHHCPYFNNDCEKCHSPVQKETSPQSHQNEPNTNNQLTDEPNTPRTAEEKVEEWNEYNTDTGGPLYPNRNEQWLRTALTEAHAAGKAEGVREGREDIIKRVEDTIAEFGDQGIECVAGILDEWFHGQREVEY